MVGGSNSNCFCISYIICAYPCSLNTVNVTSLTAELSVIFIFIAVYKKQEMWHGKKEHYWFVKSWGKFLWGLTIQISLLLSVRLPCLVSSCCSFSSTMLINGHVRFLSIEHLSPWLSRYTSIRQGGSFYFQASCMFICSNVCSALFLKKRYNLFKEF